VTIAFNLPGQVSIYTFSLLVGAGASLGLFWTAQQSGLRNRQSYIAVGISALIGGFLGGRFGYALLNLDYFQDHLQETLLLPWGGLTWSGALLGMALAGWLASAYQHLSPLKALDLLFPMVAALSISLWLGCWMDGCAFGAPSSSWFALPARDDWGNLVSRFPLQLLGALLGFLTILLFDRIRPLLPGPGTAGSFGLFLLAIQSLWLTTHRADPIPFIRAMRADLLAAYAFTILSFLLFVIAIARWFLVTRPRAVAGNQKD